MTSDLPPASSTLQTAGAKDLNIKILLKEIAARLPVLRTNIHVLSLLMGLATYIPGLSRILSEGTGGTISARYCYSVWLRHLTMAHKNGLSIRPDTIAEIGPGDSLGIGGEGTPDLEVARASIRKILRAGKYEVPLHRLRLC